MKNQRLVFLTNGKEKYIDDILFLAKQIKNPVVILGAEKREEKIYKNNNYIFTKNIQRILQNIQKEDIVIIYGGYYNEIRLNHIIHFLKNSNIFILCDGLSIERKYFNIGRNEDRTNMKILYHKIASYIRFFGLYKIAILFYQKISQKKWGNHFTKKDFGWIEMNRLEVPETIMEGKKILILEQPFLKSLAKEEIEKVFSFINELAQKNTNREVIFKIHPRSDESFYQKYIKEKNITFSKGDILPLIEKAEYILGFFSGALFTGLLFKKKIVVINTIPIFHKIKDFSLLKYNNTTHIKVAANLDTLKFKDNGAVFKKDDLQFDIEGFVDYLETR